MNSQVQELLSLPVMCLSTAQYMTLRDVVAGKNTVVGKHSFIVNFVDSKVRSDNVAHQFILSEFVISIDYGAFLSLLNNRFMDNEMYTMS